MLLCVALSYEEHDTTQTIEQLLPNSPLAHITTPPVAELTQCQLLDQVECLQLYWGQIMEVLNSFPESYLTRHALAPFQCYSSALRASDSRHSSPSFVAHCVTFCGTMTSYAPPESRRTRARRGRSGR